MLLRKLQEFYQNTYKHKSFRDMLNITRVLIMLFDTLIIAFFTNIYLTGLMSEKTFIILMVLSTIYLYIFTFKHVYLEYHKYATTKAVVLNLKKLTFYLIIEAIIFSLILIYAYFYIKSIYV